MLHSIAETHILLELRKERHHQKWSCCLRLALMTRNNRENLKDFYMEGQCEDIGKWTISYVSVEES